MAESAPYPNYDRSIPAFLRKSVEADVEWITPQRFLGRPGRGLWGRLTVPEYPTRLDELFVADMPWFVLDYLKRIVYEGAPEEAVVKAFIEALAESPAGAHITRHGRRAIRALFADDLDHVDLRQRLRAAFASATPTDWPAPAELAENDKDAARALID